MKDKRREDETDTARPAQLPSILHRRRAPSCCRRCCRPHLLTGTAPTESPEPAGECQLFFLNPHLSTFFPLLLEKEEGGGRERETLIGYLLVCTLTRDQTRNLGKCPDGELTPQLLGVRDDTATEPLGPGHCQLSATSSHLVLAVTL